jgi:hypothetical protein
LVAGRHFIYKQHMFPEFSSFPNGRVSSNGKVFFGIFGANRRRGMLTAVAGGLLLFGAAQQLLAKTMSLIVGIALGAAAIIALISSNVLGLAAANGWTEILWDVSAAILLFNTAIPRREKTIEEDDSGARQRQVRPATVPADGDTRPVPDGHQDIGARPTARVGRGALRDEE